MAKVSEQISKANASMQGKTDSNLANDSNHLGGIPANEYATQEYVRKYHDEKEALQKKYIDAQDKKILEEAKEYANSQIRNQDFSSFAKVTDVQTLKKNLEEKIQKGDNDQKSYTDQKTQEIVKDTNENFKQVETAISKINSNIGTMEGEMDKLFTSVSNGKSQIAEAITGKGVSTSATDTFSTMAGNIKNITTGSGEIPEGFVNTNDATAIASDLVLGKTAYAKGEKVFGTLIAQTEPGQPTYGLDTSDATASPGDVAAGKTFYARGQKMTGSLYDGEIEEIYGVNSDNPVYKQLIGLSDVDPITKETITERKLISFSKNLDYCVCCSTINEQTYVESYAINENGIYIQGNTNGSGETTYKKYRYSYSDLGLSEDEKIQDLELTAPGFMGYGDRCLLVIVTKQTIENPTTVNFNLHLYTYNLTENGVIGKMYDAQKDVINHVETLFTNNYNYGFEVMRIASFNLKNNKLYAVKGFSDGGSGLSYALYDISIFYGLNGISISYTTKISERDPYAYRNVPIDKGNFIVSSDDKFASFVNTGGFAGATPFIYIDVDDTPRLGISYHRNTYNMLNVKGTNIYVHQDGENNVRLFKMELDTENNLITTYLKQIFFGVNRNSIYSFVFTNDNKIVAVQGNNNTFIVDDIFHYSIYSLEDLLNASNGGNITSVYEMPINRGKFLATDNNTKIFGFDVNKGESGKYSSLALNSLLLEANLQNVIGLKYKGNYFYRQDPHILTAGQPDVRKGKTFIGWMGTQEVGTMEVNET